MAAASRARPLDLSDEDAGAKEDSDEYVPSEDGDSSLSSSSEDEAVRPAPPPPSRAGLPTIPQSGRIVFDVVVPGVHVLRGHACESCATPTTLRRFSLTRTSRLGHYLLTADCLRHGHHLGLASGLLTWEEAHVSMAAALATWKQTGDWVATYAGE